MGKIIVIGGGAAGMMAAIAAGQKGNEVVLLEKNEKLGKKIFITGKGRCNVTNASDLDEIFKNIVKNNKFLYSALYSFTNDDLCTLIEENGTPLKTERGNRVFPVSDKSSDIIDALKRALKKNNVKIRLNSEVVDIILKGDEEKAFDYCILKSGEKISGDKLIIATGGKSYESTGSDGWGIEKASKLGHRCTELLPGLVPVIIKEEFVKELQGLSLKNVTASFISGKKTVYSEFGEMLFTHFGVSGPVIISASSVINRLKNKEDLQLVIDLKPALTKEELDKRILRDFDEFKNKNFGNSLDKLLPRKLIPVIVNLSGISPDKKVNEISKSERQRLVEVLKNMKMSVVGLRGFNEAIITCGGVDVKDVNPATMESKIVKNLYFCGEMLDIDAFTGGYNLQIAWSTGHLAGESV